MLFRSMPLPCTHLPCPPTPLHPLSCTLPELPGSFLPRPPHMPTLPLPLHMQARMLTDTQAQHTQWMHCSHMHAHTKSGHFYNGCTLATKATSGYSQRMCTLNEGTFSTTAHTVDAHTNPSLISHITPACPMCIYIAPACACPTCTCIAPACPRHT